MLTIYVEAQPIHGLDAGAEIQCVADVVWGTDGTEQRVRFDIMRGSAISIVCRTLRLSARNLGNRAMRVSASVGPATRAAAREAQLTAVGTSLAGGQAATFEVPAYAAWLELWRGRERETECEIDFAFPVPASPLYTVRAAPGERMPRMPIANGCSRATVRNTSPAGPERDDRISLASAFTPTLIWGLWL